MKNGKEKLIDALDECLSEEISAVPANNQIKKMHKFTSKFIDNMSKVLKREQKKENIKYIMNHKNMIYKAAACIAAILVIAIGVKTSIWDTFTKDYLSTDTYVEDSEEFSIESAETTSEGSAGEENSSKGNASAGEKTEESVSEDANYGEASNVFEGWMLDSITDDEVTFVINNYTDTRLNYSSITQVEKYINNEWIIVYQYDDDLDNDVIEAGGMVGETIELETLNCDTRGTYRATRIINEKNVVLEFVY